MTRCCLKHPLDLKQNDIEMNYNMMHSVKSEWGYTVCGPGLANLVTEFAQFFLLFF